MLIDELTASLPPSEDAATGENLDHRARAVLRLLVDRMEPGPSEVISSDPATCPNCGVSVYSKSTPYCSDCCRERTAFVRQMRDGLAKETLLDPARQVMKGEVLWRLLGGGLPRRLALVPESSRRAVFKRSEGKCEVCGAPATTIDNTGSG